MIIVTQSSARSVLWAGLFWTTEIKPRALSFVRAEHKGIIITKHLNIIPQNVPHCKVWYLHTKEGRCFLMGCVTATITLEN